MNRQSMSDSFVAMFVVNVAPSVVLRTVGAAYFVAERVVSIL
ncbi:putative membrane protein [Mycobacterium ulcerans str. Harvey]|uniref:Membrane protein n=1 Tax=Mycobacterium ulcerans str. Harvey TaxID=1299332 RepID=A0ABN0QZQ1_MYCUL|nr:putative membrane protein [Mycobacterium ulcerans str. Harvey]